MNLIVEHLSKQLEVTRDALVENHLPVFLAVEVLLDLGCVYTDSITPDVRHTAHL